MSVEANLILNVSKKRLYRTETDLVVTVKLDFIKFGGCFRLNIFISLDVIKLFCYWAPWVFVFGCWENLGKLLGWLSFWLSFLILGHGDVLVVIWVGWERRWLIGFSGQRFWTEGSGEGGTVRWGLDLVIVLGGLGAGEVSGSELVRCCCWFCILFLFLFLFLLGFCDGVAAGRLEAPTIAIRVVFAGVYGRAGSVFVTRR